MNGHTDAVHKSLGELFYYSLHRDKVLQFLDDTNEQTTYLELLQWSIRTAIKLKKIGISRQDIVSSYTHSQKYSPVPFIATQFLGAICCNLDPYLPHLDTVHLLQLIQPKIMFVSEESQSFIEICVREACVTTEIVVFGISNKFRQFSEFIEPSEKESSFQIEQIESSTDTAVIFFTSGTTGLPKGVCLSHKALLKSTGIKGLLNDNNKNIVVLLYTPLYWISAAYFLIRSIRFGYSCVISVKFDPKYAWKLIEKYQVTTMFLAPYDATDFVNNKSVNVSTSSLDTVLVGCSAVTLKLMNSLKELLPGTRVFQVYGQTESALLITMFNAMTSEGYNTQLEKPLSSGKILDGMKWKVVDGDTDKRLGPNQRGELRIKFDGYLMNGYYKMDSSSAYDSEGYFKTDDIVYYDEDDCFYIVGRCKGIFIYRGWHILPDTIENVLLSHPAVKEAAVLGVPHENDGAHAMAVIVLFDGYDKNCEKEIEDYVNDRVIDSHKLRAGIKIVDNIPKTSSKKIKRNKLLNMMITMTQNKI